MSARLAVALLLVAAALSPSGCARSRAAADSVWGGFQGLNSDVEHGGSWGPTDHDWQEPVGGR